MNRFNPALRLAGCLSLALSVAAGVSGWQRGGHWLECLLWAVLSVLAVLVVHILPALLYRRGWLALAAFPVWLGVFAVVVFGHAQFFTLAEIHAGRDRALQAVANRADTPALIQPPAKAVTPPRTAASVARDLAKATAVLVWLPQAKRPAQQQAVDALRLELAAVQQQEARQQADHEQQQASLAARQADPVGQRLAHALTLSPDAVMLAVSLVTALMLELASVILWYLALTAPVPCRIEAGIPAIKQHIRDALAKCWPRSQPDQAPVSADDPAPGMALAPSEPEAPAVQAASTAPAPVTDSDIQAILLLLRTKGAVSLGTLQASISRRLRPALADLLARLEAAGQVRVIRHSRGQVVELAG